MDKIIKPNPKKLLDKGEKITYVCIYDIIDASINSNFITIPFQIESNLGGKNIGTVQWSYLKEKSNLEVNLLYETYVFTSLSHNGKQIGSITFNGFYPDEGSDGITKTQMYKFTVLGSTGIYQGINNVVIDFTTSIRKLYFVTKYGK